jgi:hypothetical protein
MLARNVHVQPHLVWITSQTLLRASAVHLVPALNPEKTKHILYNSSLYVLQSHHGGRSCTALGASSLSGSTDDRDDDHAAQEQFAVLCITGDGRCLFRSLAQGAHLAEQSEQSGLEKARMRLLTPPEEISAADDLRAGICEELLRQREVSGMIGTWLVLYRTVSFSEALFCHYSYFIYRRRTWHLLSRATLSDTWIACDIHGFGVASPSSRYLQTSLEEG